MSTHLNNVTYNNDFIPFEKIPRCSLVPTNNDDLCNRTYVDSVIPTTTRIIKQYNNTTNFLQAATYYLGNGVSDNSSYIPVMAAIGISGTVIRATCSSPSTAFAGQSRTFTLMNFNSVVGALGTLSDTTTVVSNNVNYVISEQDFLSVRVINSATSGTAIALSCVLVIEVTI